MQFHEIKTMDGKTKMGSRPDMPAGDEQPMAKRLVQPQVEMKNEGVGARTTRGAVPGADGESGSVVSTAGQIKIGDNPTGRHGTQSTGAMGTKQRPWTPQKP